MHSLVFRNSMFFNFGSPDRMTDFINPMANTLWLG